MKIHNQDAAVFFGPPDAPLPDWRKGIDGDVDPDDEELDVTPPDVVAVLGFDPKEFSEVGEKAFCPTGPGGGIDNSCSPHHAADAGGRFSTPFGTFGADTPQGDTSAIPPPSPGYAEDLIRDMKNRIAKSGKASWQNPDAHVAFGHRIENMGGIEAHQTLLGMAEQIEKASSRDAMLKTFGSQDQWGTNYSSARDEWLAAQALGASNSMPKDTKEVTKAATALTDVEVRAYAKRTELIQAYVRQNYGDEFTLYRGVGARQYNKIALRDKTNDPTDEEGRHIVPVAVHGLSSWTTDSYDAGDFAKAKGIVLKVKVKAEDVWLLPRELTPPQVMRFVEDRGEMVIRNSTGMVNAVVHGPGHKPRRR